MIKIGDDIVGILNEDGKEKKVRKGEWRKFMIVNKMKVSSWRRMNEKRKSIEKIGKKREKLENIKEIKKRLIKEIDEESEKGKRKIRRIFMMKGMIFVMRKKGIIEKG